MSDSQPTELTQLTNSGLPALVRSPPSNSSVPNSAELPLEEKRGEANIDSSSGESDTAEPKVPKVPARNIKPKPPPLDSRSLNVNLSSNQQGQVYRRSQTHSSLQAARLALQIKELQLQQAAVLGPRSNGDGTLTVPFSAPRTPTSPTQPPRFPLPPIPPMTPLTANQITNAEPLHADYQPPTPMTNPHPNPTSKGTSEDSGVQSDNVRGAPPSPLGSSPFCRLPKQTYRSRIDISQEPELPASYKQRMMNIQRDSATTTTATSKDGERQPVRYSANTLSSSRDRDTNANSNEQHDASDSKKERSPYDYPPMTPATIPDSHRRDYDEDVPEMPPLPASVVGSSYLRRVPSLPLLNRTGTHSRRLEHAQTARVPTSEFASEPELPPSYLQRFNDLNKHDSRHPTRPPPSRSHHINGRIPDSDDHAFSDSEIPRHRAAVVGFPGSFDTVIDITRDDTLHSHIHRADLSAWSEWPNPNANALETGEISNLPSWKDVQEGSPTSYPNRSTKRDIEYSLKRLLNIQVFETLLNDPLGRYRFRDWLISEGESTASMDMWLDLNYHAKLLDELNESAEALYDIYLSHGSSHRVKLPQPMVREVESVIRRKLSRPNLALSSPQQYLLESMYSNEFQSFVKQRLIEQAEVKLGRHKVANADGLGDCFCLTNPRLPDHPIVLVSDGFNAVTGYPRSQIVGRNCRFLQGPGTSPESVQRIRDALNRSEACTELLLNYRRDGTPFYCLLCIIPLRDHNGNLVYYIGGQTNVTSVFAEDRASSFLITGGTTNNLSTMPPNLPNFSPSMMDYRGMGLSQSHTSKTSLNSVRGSAAGAIDPAAVNHQSSDANSNSLGAKIGRLFKKPSIESDMFRGTIPIPQYISTSVEAPRKLDTQIPFRNVYSKLIVMRKAKREIIFVTADLLGYLGLPCSTTKELYSSPLIHCDLLDCITAGEKRATKSLRYRIKDAVDAEESLSVEIGLKMAIGAWGSIKVRGDRTLRYGYMHMTPLKERDGQCLAYVCIFSPK